MPWVCPLHKISKPGIHLVGGKAAALSQLIAAGFKVPPGLAVTTKAYDYFVEFNGLKGTIALEVHRKREDQLRWEEMWDASLRIRNKFLHSPFPKDLESELSKTIQSIFRSKGTAVRSSAPGEDSAKTSFAGVHESYVNVHGVKEILKHVKLVWASLWSDAAILYRKELGLDTSASRMAVVIQEFVPGDVSGIIFTRNPLEDKEAVVEAVFGLNQGLVDGTIPPDRWVLSRDSGRILATQKGGQNKHIDVSKQGIQLKKGIKGDRQQPSLSEEQLHRLFTSAQKAEILFGEPQDIEWTLRSNSFYFLQSRPITTPSDEPEPRSKEWYMTLRPSFEKLNKLRHKIETEIIPGMTKAAQEPVDIHLNSLEDTDLADEVRRRQSLVKHWTKVYWDDLIPFAHGMRLFGQIYNDTLSPGDPYEFIDLLRPDNMESLSRNNLLMDMAELLHGSPQMRKELADRGPEAVTSKEFQSRYQAYLEEYGEIDLSDTNAPSGLTGFLLQLAEKPQEKKSFSDGKKKRQKLEKKYFSAFPDKDENFANELLDLGRFSYRMRDDDNIYLGRIEKTLEKGRKEAVRRLRDRGLALKGRFSEQEIIRALKNPGYKPVPAKQGKAAPDTPIKARQIKGQPAGKGLVTGKARVILEQADLMSFKKDDILVCDAVEPHMTLVVPLAKAIVERRGGMLIHGAIIAREYSIPCVTGIPEATRLIRTGDIITVDGHLGIVIIEKRKSSAVFN
jgi:rifampicin phosphotransferase